MIVKIKVLKKTKQKMAYKKSYNLFNLLNVKVALISKILKNKLQFFKIKLFIFSKKSISKKFSNQ